MSRINFLNISLIYHNRKIGKDNMVIATWAQVGSTERPSMVTDTYMLVDSTVEFSGSIRGDSLKTDKKMWGLTYVFYAPVKLEDQQ